MKTEINAQSSTEITIDSHAVLHPVSPGLIGVNHRYFSDALGMWNAETNNVDADFLAAFKTINPKCLRYPGGTTGNLFHWKQAIGPVSQRTPQVEPYNAFAPEVAVYGLDEALRFAEENGLETIWVYNTGNGNAKDAAELVEYLNAPDDGEHPMASLRAANGHPEPYNIKSFELGNEIYAFAELLPGLDQEFWLRGESDKTPAQLYLYGGTVTFTDQPVGLQSDWRKSASMSDGTPGQVKYIKYAPVDPDPDGTTLKIKINDEIWQRVSTFDDCGNKPVFMLDDQSGRIIFGDGENGAIPPKDSVITAKYNTTHDGAEDYISAMKSIDPSINVYLAMNKIEVLQEAGTRLNYDGMVIHPYIFFETPFDADDISSYYYASMVSADNRSREISTLKENLMSYSGRTLKPIVTEYGLIDSQYKSSSSSPTGKAIWYEGSLGSALNSCRQLIDFIKMELDYALKHSLIDKTFDYSDATPLALIDSYTFNKSTHAYMMEIFSGFVGEKRVKTDLINAPYQTVTIIQDGTSVSKDIKLLSELATVSENALYLIVLNIAADQNVDAVIKLKGQPSQDVEIATLSSENIADFNNDDFPDRVRTISSTLTVNAEEVTYSFPAHSLTAMKFTFN